MSWWRRFLFRGVRNGDSPQRDELVVHMRARDLISESMAGILQRPGRSTLTILGTVLGIGAFVAILGITATTRGQISNRFTALLATSVSVEDVGKAGPANEPIFFPQDSDSRMQSLNGVLEAGVWWRVPDQRLLSGLLTGRGEDGLGVLAASPGVLRAMEPSIEQGKLYDDFHNKRGLRVAVLGRGVANRLGILRLSNQPAVFIRGIPFTVIGILRDVKRLPESLDAALVPSRTALNILGPPGDDRARMLVETRLGAAPLVAQQAPLALRAEAPELFRAVPPPDPRTLGEAVTSDLGSLFLLLGVISLVIGALGIANTTLVAVLERRSEIGVRRAVGAGPANIAAQFLLESTILGLLGGLIGTSLGVIAVLAVSLFRHWTAILDPISVLPAPLIGAFVGLLAGAYPAARASRVEPAVVLRQ